MTNGSKPMSIQEHAERVAADAPPLSAAQRDRIASLFHPTAGSFDDDLAILDEVVRGG